MFELYAWDEVEKELEGPTMCRQAAVRMNMSNAGRGEHYEVAY